MCRLPQQAHYHGGHKRGGNQTGEQRRPLKMKPRYTLRCMSRHNTTASSKAASKASQTLGPVA
jgi:hypothetical protein